MTTTLGALEFDEYLPQSPAAVWQALTTPELLEKWWAPNNIRAEVGHRFTFDMGRWGVQECEVLVVEVERRLSYSFSTFSTLTWTLEANGTGTHLRLVHDGFDLDSPLGKSAYEGMGQGWPSVLQRLSALLADQ
ncbi:SRPBCC family protein [Saccharospirillum mangrovi]|uniref:SRPBCC family protein n=1 Tax=Saccharospirillum mangrovi TaxID=2161747 RepID=UPI000D39E6D3|nr:SRPBCC domain-containing protein [Saccharospirillum mangrovi]